MRAVGARLGVDAGARGRRPQGGRSPARHRAAGRRGRRLPAVVASASTARLEDVFAIQDEIAESVATALRGLLSRRTNAKRSAGPRPRVETYEYFLRGRQLLNQLAVVPSLEAAQGMFERAIEIDPAYAPAWAGLADGPLPGSTSGGAATTTTSRRRTAPAAPPSSSRRGWRRRTQRGASCCRSSGTTRRPRSGSKRRMRLNPNSVRGALSLRPHVLRLGAASSGPPSSSARAASVRPEDFQSLILLGPIAPHARAQRGSRDGQPGRHPARRAPARARSDGRQGALPRRDALAAPTATGDKALRWSERGARAAIPTIRECCSTEPACERGWA